MAAVYELAAVMPASRREAESIDALERRWRALQDACTVPQVPCHRALKHPGTPSPGVADMPAIGTSRTHC